MSAIGFFSLRNPLSQGSIKFFLAVVITLFISGVRTQAATIVVPPTGDLQAALNAVQCGDTIVLQAGGTYLITMLEQPFMAKAKGPCTGTSADFITIQGSNFASLPASFRDLSPAQINALNLPKFVTKVSTPALEFEAGSHHYRFVGIEITNDSVNQTQLNNGLVFVGENSGSQSTINLGNVPHDIEFDRCYVHAEVADGTTSEYSTAVRGFSVSAKNLTIKNSRIAGFRAFWKPGQTNPLSSNAILINKGPGPYTIVGNYMEAWFGTLFTGGGPQWVTNSAAVAPGASTTQATLTNVVGTLPAVGDYIAFLAPGMTYTVGVYHDQPYEWGAAKVTAVNGNTITYVPQLSNNVQSVWGIGPGGTPLTAAPSSPGMAVWNGDRPKDILIAGNQFVKEPVSLVVVRDQYGYSPKGHIELKVGLRTTINANTFEGYHLAFVITSRNQSSQQEGGGKEVWSTIDDTVFTNNWVKPAPGVGHVFGIFLEDETNTVVPGQNFRVENNLFESGTKFINIGASRNVQFIHNTFTGNSGTPTETDQAVFGLGGSNANFLMRDNIFYNNGYGLNCQISPNTLNACFGSSLSLNGNVVVDNRSAAQILFQGLLSALYPAGNYYTGTLANVQFVDPSVGNWRLSPSSPYRGAGTSGTDPGVNMDTLVAALGTEYNPDPTPSPSPTPNPNPTPTPTPGPGYDVVWVEDSVPAGASVDGDGEGWTWVNTNPAQYSGSAAHQSAVAEGSHQHYFYGTSSPLSVNTGEKLFAYVWLDSANLPGEIMLQWKDGESGWEHRAYWGGNYLNSGADGTVARHFMGPLPASGQWVRLEVPADQVGLEGKSINGMAFTLFGGRATWDRAGKVSQAAPLRIMTTADDGSAVVLNARTFRANNIEVTTPENLGPDKRTRLMVFATGISGRAINSDPSNDVMVNGVLRPNLSESVVVEARTSDGRVIQLPIEFAGTQGVLPDLDQIDVVLLQELQGAGMVQLTLIVNGQRSNSSTIVIL